jgi:hypothetical protein
VSHSPGSATIRLFLTARLVAGLLVASVLIWMMWSTGRADAGSLLAARKARCVERASWLTGPRSASRTDLNWNVHGADLGHPLLQGDDLYLVFGDTFGRTGRGGPDWRSNTMARVSSPEPGDEFVIADMVTDDTGEAAELLPSMKVDGIEKTVIPTYGIGVGDEMVLHYMSVRRWSSPGRWEVAHAGFASSVDDGVTWTVHDEQLDGDGNFAQVAMVALDEHVLLYGIPAGRFGGVQLARARPAELTRPSTYEYWNGRDWTGHAGAAVDIVPAPVGELSVRWSETLERWLMMYLDETLRAVVVRSAPEPVGPWSTPRIVTTDRQYPLSYAPYFIPTPDRDGQTYFTLSQFGPYQVSLMRLDLSCLV